MGNIMISFIGVVILTSIIILLRYSGVTIVKFICDGGDMRTLTLMEFLMFFLIYIWAMIDYFIHLKSSSLGIICSRLYIAVTLYLLVSGRFMMFRAALTDRRLKTFLYTFLWLIFFGMVVYAFNIVAILRTVEVGTNSIDIALSKLVSYTSYNRVRYEMNKIGRINKIDSLIIVSFIYYILMVAICITIDAREERKSLKKNVIIFILYLIVIMGSEVIGDDGIQLLIAYKFNGDILIMINSLVFILYSLLPMWAFIEECKSIIYYTKPMEDTRITMLIELIHEARQCKKDKFSKEIEEKASILLPIIAPMFKVEPALWGKLPLRRRDERFIRYLSKRLEKEYNNENDDMEG